MGRGCPLCPGNSDVYLFGNLKGVVDLYAQIPDSTFNLGMSEEQLNRPQVASSFVNHGGFGPSQGMCAKETRVQTAARNPIRN